MEAPTTPEQVMAKAGGRTVPLGRRARGEVGTAKPKADEREGKPKGANDAKPLQERPIPHPAVPQDWPSGWDVADAPPEGVSIDQPCKMAQPGTSSKIAGLSEFLDAQSWAARDIPPSEKLLGELIDNTIRLFIVGPTGLGKTNLGLAMAVGASSGTGFLHWRSSRPARVLYVDGEMSSRLIKDRMNDALRRAEKKPDRGTLILYSQDFAEQIEKAFPTLGRMKPLNLPDGHAFLLSFIDAIGGVDVVMLDNVMSLCEGVMKEEQTFNGVLPLVAALSARRIGQVWFDHTGLDKSRQYGPSAKAWRFDTVAIMSELPESERRERELGFRLSFDPPGKARRRTPDNWDDFAPVTIRLASDQWTVERQEVAERPSKSRCKVSAMALAFHQALVDALCANPTSGTTTRDAWYAEGVRLGLLDEIGANDDYKTRDRKRSKLRKFIGDLKAAGFIGVDGNTVRNLREGRKK